MAPGFKTGGKIKGSKNKSTIEREQQVMAARKGSRELAREVMERAMIIAEATFMLYKPPSPAAIARAEKRGEELLPGDTALFGQWFDRWTFLAKELTKYQSPPIKAVEAPAPPPDPKDLDQRSRKRFGLRVFEGGRPLNPAGNEAA